MKRAGTYGHEVADANTWAQWGVDYAKLGGRVFSCCNARRCSMLINSTAALIAVPFRLHAGRLVWQRRACANMVPEDVEGAEQHG
eukprot:SAG31_NODE_926_length_10930_cov_135.691626_3_plen_85_part_00